MNQQQVQQQALVVNAKTKTALANMLSIRLQSGQSGVGVGTPAQVMGQTNTGISLHEPPSACPELVLQSDSSTESNGVVSV